MSSKSETIMERVNKAFTKAFAQAIHAASDRMFYGQSFERITATRCEVCNGSGCVEFSSRPEIHSVIYATCPSCGGKGMRETRERIDPRRVVILDECESKGGAT